MNQAPFYTEEKKRFHKPDLEGHALWRWARGVYSPAPVGLIQTPSDLIQWWTEPECFSDLWIIACDRSFDRNWMESWSAYAQSQGRGFLHLPLQTGWNSLFFIMKDRPQSRILIGTNWCSDQDIWPPCS